MAEFIIFLVWFGGGALSVGIFRARAGLVFMGNLLLGFQNFGWSALTVSKAFVWPVVLIVWLVTGSKPSPWRIQGDKIVRQEVAA